MRNNSCDIFVLYNYYGSNLYLYFRELINNTFCGEGVAGGQVDVAMGGLQGGLSVQGRGNMSKQGH